MHRWVSEQKLGRGGGRDGRWGNTGGMEGRQVDVWHVHIMVLKYRVGAAEQWGGGWFLLALFGAILTWEEVWDLPNSAY